MRGRETREVVTDASVTRLVTPMSKFTIYTMPNINNYITVALVPSPGNIDEVAQNLEHNQINEAIG
jgi:hypothetical protein